MIWTKNKTWRSLLMSGALLITAQMASAAVSGLTATSDASSVTIRYNYTDAPSFFRLYVDTDLNASTGYPVAGTGAEFLIENNSLYRYSGSAGSWSWAFVKTVTQVKSPTSSQWTVARIDLRTPTSLRLVGQTSSPVSNSGILVHHLSSQAPTTTTMLPPASWVRCAVENGVCSFSGTRQVRYGANGTYAFKTATGSIACNNATFGDPVYGVAKFCDYSSTAVIVTTTTMAPPPTTTTVPAATNSISLTVAGAPNLAYNGTTTLVRVGFVGTTPSSVSLARDGFAAFATWPGGTFFTLSSDGKSISGNWCISASCWGNQSGTHILTATATYANGSTKSASVTLNVSDSATPTTTTTMRPPTTTTLPSGSTGPAYYLSPSGNDANAGTQSAPWRTIQKAADTVSAGSLVILMNGTYTEPSINMRRSGTSTAPITFRAQNKWQAIIASTSGCNPGVAVYASYITLQDIRFSVSPQNPNCGIYTSSNAHIRAWFAQEATPSNPTTGYQGFVARGLKLDNSPARSEGMKSNQDFTIFENNEVSMSMEFFNTKDSIIRNNVTLGQGSHGISIFVKGGVRNTQIYGNIIRNKKVNGQGILIGGFSCDLCFFDRSTKIEAYNVVAYNNVVINESGGGMAALMFQGAKDSAFFNNVVINGALAMTTGGHNTGSVAPTSNPTFKNNIVICNGASLTSGFGWSYTGTLNMDYNNFYNCSGAPAQVHTISGNPLFVNQASDWHLQSGSSALNTGTPVTMPAYGGGSIDISRDKDGVVRSAPWDLGVYNQ